MPISQTIFAGIEPKPLKPCTAARIYTGAMIPEGANTVELQENCDITEKQVTFHQPQQIGQHIRLKGEDIQQNSCIVKQGTRLSPQHIGLLASSGIAEVSIYKPLTISLIVSGDELVSPPSPLKAGQIYNSNLPLLTAALSQSGFTVNTHHVVDDLSATKNILKRCIQTSDIILTTGGVSVGDADFIKTAINQLGEINFWKVAMKPGKPLTFGYVKDNEKRVPIIGLPGNPVSAFASFNLFALPFLYKLQGWLEPTPPLARLPITLNKALNPKREEFMRVKREEKSGKLTLTPFKKQGSGVLSSVVFATGFARIPNNQVTENGDLVTYIDFNRYR